MVAMRTILVVLDGLGDKGIKELDGMTPLQDAFTPNMDLIATAGSTGLYHSSMLGIALPSEIAHFIIFGYDPSDFPGRGYIEALGHGIPLGNYDVAFLARFLHVEPSWEGFVLVHEKIKVDPGEFRSLCSSVSPWSSEGLEIELYPTGGNGGVAVLRGSASPAVTDSNPIYEGRPVMEVQPISGAAETSMSSRTSEFLNSYTISTYETLTKHPVNIRRIESGRIPLNMVTTQRPGRFRPLPSFREKWGMKALCIASGGIYHGLCGMLGMDVVKESDTGDWGADLLTRLQKAYAAKDHDFIYVHTKGPDEAAHTGNPIEKRRVIESLDTAMGWAARNILPDDEVLLVLTSDHSTASTGNMIHSGESVPLVMAGKYARKDNVRSFNEVDCAGGALGSMRGREIMYMILNLMDRGKLLGLMDSPVDQPFFPGPYRILKRDHGRKAQDPSF